MACTWNKWFISYRCKNWILFFSNSFLFLILNLNILFLFSCFMNLFRLTDQNIWYRYIFMPVEFSFILILRYTFINFNYYILCTHTFIFKKKKIIWLNNCPIFKNFYIINQSTFIKITGPFHTNNVTYILFIYWKI